MEKIHKFYHKTCVSLEVWLANFKKRNYFRIKHYFVFMVGALDATTSILTGLMSSKLYEYIVNSSSYLEEVKNRINTSYAKRDSSITQLKNLRESYVNQKLILVLGAGISQDYGLPDWNTLLQKLLIKSLESEPETNNDSKNTANLLKAIFSPNPLVLARNIQLRCRNSNRGELSFEQDVRDAIYEEINNDIISPIFKEIRQFCIAPGKSPNLDSIITFNYDDILENCLSQLEIEIPFKSIYSAGMRSKSGELPIYHVHGYLPRNIELKSENKITLSEDIYHQLYTDIYYWSNIVQINKFTNFTCLFIGTSFTDPNLRRLLDIAKEQRGDSLISHYIFRKRHEKEQIKAMISKIISETGEKIISSEEEFNNKMENTVQSLISIMERFEEEDALSFGVSIIWINNYDEIPIILGKIRSS